MWILPKQLISAFAQDTEALTLDSVELSQTCAQSLMRRSKPSPAKTYLREWKVGNLMRLRSGAISSPSLGNSFLDWWTSSLAGSRANHSPAPASEQETRTNDTSSRTFWKGLADADLPLFSLKMLKESSPASLPETIGTTQPALRYCSMSLGSWSGWVTRQRQAYSARLSAARLTSANECSSWPTATTRDWKDTGDMSQSMIRKDGKERITLGRVVQANHSTHGSRPESWQTPDVGSVAGGRSSRGQSAPEKASLEKQAKAWATPRAEMDSGAHRGQPDTLHSQIKQAASGKLNPRWVETLMGLPVGWTMPSCQLPVTTVPTNCGC